LIIGDAADPHVAVVTGLLPESGVVVLDAASLPSVAETIGLEESILLDMAGRPVRLAPGCGARGWVRRFAPAGWDGGVRLGSHRAAVLAARMGLLGAVLRDPAVTWLTPVDRLVAAENKIVQYRAAVELGVRVPETIVSRDPGVLAGLLGEPFVLKPLGPGNFEDENGQQQVVFASTTSAADLAGTDLADAPFLAQRRLDASKHLRIVTVRDRAWTTVLDAAGLPCDWRRHGPAHHAFRTDESTRGTDVSALALAGRLGVGYSSQDWLVDEDGSCFLDLNPGGQWLFLPHEVATAVAIQMANWLEGGLAA
jgi:hypothetical protein